MKKSTRKRRSSKSAKPHADFPLWKHPSGRWCKKVKGRAFYFGKVADDPDGKAALERWLAEKDYRLAGRTPPTDTDGLKVADMCNRFLAFKERAVDAGELSPHTFDTYLKTCARLTDAFGRHRLVADLGPDDFGGFRAKLAKAWGPATLSTEVGRVRAVFRWAVDTDLVDKVRYGQGFKAPPRRALMAAKHARGTKLFEPVEFRRILKKAPMPLKAYVLLGINAAYGPHDVAMLPRDAIDLKGGWVSFPRPKTAVIRRCPLWPETVAAVRDALVNRPRPVNPEHDYLAFLGQYGRPCFRDDQNNTIAQWFRAHIIRLGLHRSGLGFSTLRHTFRTVADETHDWPAVNLIMGHCDRTMGGVYRQKISDDRLEAVTEHVRKWLFGNAEKE